MDKKTQLMTDLKPLTKSDYELGSDGVKTVTFGGMAKREKNLYILQNLHRPILKKFLESLGYSIIKEWRASDGWGCFKIDYFTIKDNRIEEIINLAGSDDNSALFEVFESGGKGLWRNIPNTTPWYKAEKENGGD